MSTSSLTFAVTIMIDNAAWAREYGLDPSQSPADLRDYFTQPAAIEAIETAVRGLTGGPITVVAVLLDPQPPRAVTP